MKKVICLGDSLTYGYQVPRRETWTARAEADAGLNFVNRGINGDTTGGMLARLGSEVLDQAPDALILTGGTNDIITSGSSANARSNVAAITHQAAARGLPCFLGTPIPVDLPRVRPDWAALTDFARMMEVTRDYVDWLLEYGRIFGFPTIDFWRLFAVGPDFGGNPELYLSDGLHPNAAGHSLMAGEVVKVLGKNGATAPIQV